MTKTKIECDDIIIKNDKIKLFFKENNKLNIEEILLVTIDLLSTVLITGQEQIENKMILLLKDNNLEINKLYNLLENNKLSNDNIKNEMEHIKTLLSNNNNNVITKLYEIKDNYINEIKSLLNHNENDKSLNIINILDKENNNLLLKMNNILTDTLSTHQIKNNNELLNILKLELLEKIRTENNPEIIINILNEKYNKILEIISEQISPDKTLLLIENKYNNLYDNVINNIKEDIDKMKTYSELTKINQEKTNNDLLNYFGRNKKSTVIGQQGEDELYQVICDLLPSSDIIRTGHETGKGDFVIHREHKESILIETKHYNSNVKREETDKFLRDIENTNYNGIFLSQTSGIVNKSNYQIDIHNNNILIYIHNVDYDPNKINIAINLIDLLSDKIKKEDLKDFKISNDTLKSINNEYNNLILTRDKMLNDLKDYYKKTMENYNNLTLISLEKILSINYATHKKIILTCEYCKKFECDNLISMTRHKNACKKKYLINQTNENNNNNNNQTNENKQELKDNKESSSETSSETKTTKNKSKNNRNIKK